MVVLGAPLLSLWYLTGVNTLFGVVVFIYMHTVALGEDAKSCAENQPTRFEWLKYEIIYFWVFFGVFNFPMGVYRFFKKEKLSEWLKDEENSERED